MELVTLHYIEINMLCIGMLLIVYTNLDKHHKKKSMLYDQLFFQLIILCCMIALFTDAIMVALDGTSFAYSRPVMILCGLIYYILHPIQCVLWLLYAENKLTQNKARQHHLLFYLPVIFLNVITLLSPFTGWVFYYDSANIYHRGPLLPLMTPLSYIYILYSIVLTFIEIKHTRDDASKTELYRYLIFFPILPVLGGILQIAFYGTSLLFPCTALALLIQYINVQNRQISTDSLTGLFNRRQIERFYNQQTKSENRHRCLYLLIIDMDNFKSINDIYGHTAGDRALIYSADILRQSFQRKYDFIARFGGDEFIIISECTNASEIPSILEMVQSHLEEFNAGSKAEFPLSMSIGASVYDAQTMKSLDDWIHRADQEMYAVKASKVSRSRASVNE